MDFLFIGITFITFLVLKDLYRLVKTHFPLILMLLVCFSTVRVLTYFGILSDQRVIFHGNRIVNKIRTKIAKADSKIDDIRKNLAADNFISQEMLDKREAQKIQDSKTDDLANIIEHNRKMARYEKIMSHSLEMKNRHQ